jgi:hypothetical protein
MDQFNIPIQKTGIFLFKNFLLLRDEKKLQKTAKKSKIKKLVKITPIQIKNRGNPTNSFNWRDLKLRSETLESW